MITEMMGNTIIASKHVKGYKFHCVGKMGNTTGYDTCNYCHRQLVTFVTIDVKEAERHCRENNMPMWISLDE